MIAATVDAYAWSIEFPRHWRCGGREIKRGGGYRGSNHAWCVARISLHWSSRSAVGTRCLSAANPVDSWREFTSTCLPSLSLLFLFLFFFVPSSVSSTVTCTPPPDLERWNAATILKMVRYFLPVLPRFSLLFVLCPLFLFFWIVLPNRSTGQDWVVDPAYCPPTLCHFRGTAFVACSSDSAFPPAMGGRLTECAFCLLLFASAFAYDTWPSILFAFFLAMVHVVGKNCTACEAIDLDDRHRINCPVFG